MAVEMGTVDDLRHKLIEEFEACCNEFVEDEPDGIDENEVFRSWLLCKLADLIASHADMSKRICGIEATLLYDETGLDINALIEATTGITEDTAVTFEERAGDYVFTYPDGTPLDEKAMRKITSNPILAGIGPYRGIVSDRVWIQANADSVRQEGAESAIRRILTLYHEAFPVLDLPDAALYVDEVDGDPTPVLQSLLGELRAIFEEGIHPGRVRVL